MITYFVRYQTFDAPQHTQTDNLETLETWTAAKQRRNEVFQFRTTRRCWVERIESVKDGELNVEMSKERFGHVLARNTPEVTP